MPTRAAPRPEAVTIELFEISDKVEGEELRDRIRRIARDYESRLEEVYEDRTRKAGKVITLLMDYESLHKQDAKEQAENLLIIRMSRMAQSLTVNPKWSGSYSEALAALKEAAN